MWADLAGVIDSVGGAWSSIETAKGGQSADPEQYREIEPTKGENADGTTIVATMTSQQQNMMMLALGGGILLVAVVLALTLVRTK